MTTRRIDADALLDLATEMLRAEVLPALPPDQRYAGAMIANALETARRALAEEVEAAEWSLLDGLYDEGEGSMAELARDIRAGALPKGKIADIAGALRTLVIAELRIRSPRFLASRGVGS